MYPFRLKLTEYYWYGLKQCIPRVFDDFLIGPKTCLMDPPPLCIKLNTKCCLHVQKIIILHLHSIDYTDY